MRLPWAVVGLGYETKALRLLHGGDESAALQMCEAAIRFDPSSSNGWAIRGFILWPDAEAVTALKKAVELGDKSYLPHYYLAYAELTRENYRQSFEHARKALELGVSQDQETRALLYQWAAISLARLEGPRGEIEALLRKATEVSPENEQARVAYRQFQAANVPDPPPLAKRDTYPTSRSVSFDDHRAMSLVG